MLSLDSILDALADRIVERIQVPAGKTPGKRLLSLKEAGVYLGRSASAVQQMVARKDLPAVRNGRRVHLLISDLEEWIERNRVDS